MAEIDLMQRIEETLSGITDGALRATVLDIAQTLTLDVSSPQREKIALAVGDVSGALRELGDDKARKRVHGWARDRFVPEDVIEATPRRGRPAKAAKR